MLLWGTAVLKFVFDLNIGHYINLVENFKHLEWSTTKKHYFNLFGRCRDVQPGLPSGRFTCLTVERRSVVSSFPAHNSSEPASAAKSWIYPTLMPFPGHCIQTKRDKKTRTDPLGPAGYDLMGNTPESSFPGWPRVFFFFLIRHYSSRVFQLKDQTSSSSVTGVFLKMQIQLISETLNQIF